MLLVTVTVLYDLCHGKLKITRTACRLMSRMALSPLSQFFSHILPLQDNTENWVIESRRVRGGITVSLHVCTP